MTHFPTANQLSGRAIGSLFFACFGAAWIALALYAKQILNPTSIACLLFGLAVLLPTSLWLYRQSKHFHKLPEDPSIGKSFHRINAIQWIAVGVCGFAFARLHMDAYVFSAITAIVGLHLFPLAKLFGYPMHYVTAIALVVWAGMGLLVVPADQLQGTTALGTGVILWLSAAISLGVGAQAARQAGLESRLNA